MPSIVQRPGATGLEGARRVPRVLGAADTRRPGGRAAWTQGLLRLPFIGGTSTARGQGTWLMLVQGDAWGWQWRQALCPRRPWSTTHWAGCTGANRVTG